MKISELLPEDKDLSNINILDSLDKLPFTNRTGEILISLILGNHKIENDLLSSSKPRIIFHLGYTAVYVLKSELKQLDYKLAN